MATYLGKFTVALKTNTFLLSDCQMTESLTVSSNDFPESKSSQNLSFWKSHFLKKEETILLYWTF